MRALFLFQSGVFGIKLNLGYKHIRFKSSIRKISNKDCVKLRVEKLSDILDCSELTARKLISKSSNILVIDSDELIRNAAFCAKNLKFSDVIEFPVLLTLNSGLLQHRYFSLLELGCINVTASSILKYPQILKQTARAAAKEGLVFDPRNPLHRFLNLLSDYEEKNESLNRIGRMYKGGSTLWKIKEAMNAEFLMDKLQCSLAGAHHMFHSYPPLRVQSIFITRLLLDVLFEKFLFSVSKIYFISNLLSLHPEVAENFLQQLPEILGVKTPHLINRQPLALRRDVNSIKEIEQILKDFSISTEQLLCCPRVISLAPNTLKQRLQSLLQSKDFAMLKMYKKFLWLVYYFNNLSPRLEALKSYDLPVSISILTASKAMFERYLSFSDCRSSLSEICFYLSGVFNYSQKEIMVKLREYPNQRSSSLTNCNQVIDFLTSSGISKKQLLNGIGIVYYDIDVVRPYFQDLKYRPECQPFSEWTTHYNLIQLLIYMIEVDAGFSGMRVYKVRSKIEERETLAISSQSY